MGWLKSWALSVGKRALSFAVHRALAKAEAEAIEHFKAEGLPGLQKVGDKFQSGICKAVRWLAAWPSKMVPEVGNLAEDICREVMAEGDKLEARAIQWAGENGPAGIKTAFEAAQVAIDAKIADL